MLKIGLSSSIAISLLVALLFSSSYSISPAKAVDPAPATTCAAYIGSTNGATCTLSGVSDGAFVVMEGQIFSSENCGGTVTPSGLGGIWVTDILQKYNYAGGICLYSFVAHSAISSASGSTCQFSDSLTNPQNLATGIECENWNNLNPTPAAIRADAGGNPGGKTCATATTCTDTVSPVLDQTTIRVISNAAAGFSTRSPSLANAAGFSLVNSGSTCNNADGTCFDGQYDGNPSGDSSASTTITLASSATINMAEAAVEFGACQNCGTVTALAACNFFQLQCWWYPLLFIGLYSGYILFVAQAIGVPSKGKAHLFLSAVTFGSLIAVILGVMNIVFPLLMLIVNTIIVMRLR